MKRLSEIISENKFPKWLTDKYIYLMIFLYPLFVGFRGYTQLTVSKFFFFSILTVFWLLSVLIIRKRGDQILKVRRPDFFTFIILLYLFFCLVSAVISPHGLSVVIGEGRFDGLITITLCCLIFLGVYRFGRMKAAYIYAFSLSGLVCCVIAVLQLLGKNPLALFPLDYVYYDAGTKYSSEFLSPIGNADLFSGFLCLLLPLSAVYYITSLKIKAPLLIVVAAAGFCLVASRVASGILAVICVSLISAPFAINTGTRLRRSLEVLAVAFAFLGLGAAFGGDGENGEVYIRLVLSKPAAALFILSFFSIIASLCIEKLELSAKALAVFFSAFSLLIVISGLFVIYLWPEKSGSVYEISQVMRGNIDESFGSSRILIWREVLNVIPERPFFGGGPGTLPLRIDLSFSRYVDDTGHYLYTYVDNAHNAYLGILVNTGLFALFCFLTAQVVSLLGAVTKGQRDPFCLCLACALLCYWIQVFFSLGLFIISPIVWVFWGLLASGIKKSTKTV